MYYYEARSSLQAPLFLTNQHSLQAVMGMTVGQYEQSASTMDGIQQIDPMPLPLPGGSTCDMASRHFFTAQLLCTERTAWPLMSFASMVHTAEVHALDLPLQQQTEEEMQQNIVSGTSPTGATQCCPNLMVSAVPPQVAVQSNCGGDSSPQLNTKHRKGLVNKRMKKTNMPATSTPTYTHAPATLLQDNGFMRPAAKSQRMTQPCTSSVLPKCPLNEAMHCETLLGYTKTINLESPGASPYQPRATPMRLSSLIPGPKEETPAFPLFSPAQDPQSLHVIYRPVMRPPTIEIPMSQSSLEPSATTPLPQKKRPKKITNIPISKQSLTQNNVENADKANTAEAEYPTPEKQNFAARPAKKSSIGERSQGELNRIALSPQSPHSTPHISVPIINLESTQGSTEEPHRHVAKPQVPMQADDSKLHTGSAVGVTLTMRERFSHTKTPSQILSLSPENGIFDRMLMLRVWRICRDELDLSVRTLSTHVRLGASQRTPNSTRPLSARGGLEHSQRITFSQSSPNTTSHFKPYVPRQQTTREAEIERRVKGLLNRICPDNLKIIVERLASISLMNTEELQLVIQIIFQKTLTDSHYCETYADMVFALRSRYPEFPPEHTGDRPHTFTRVLLNTCQNEFENLIEAVEPTEEEKHNLSADDLSLEIKTRKDKILANMKFIGNLFLRRLLGIKVICYVVHDLIGMNERLPEEHMIECVCVLLQAIGYTLEETEQGRRLMSQFCGRLMELKTTLGPDGQATFSKRIRFLMQDLLDSRNNGWKKRDFKMQPKAKEDIRKDSQRAANDGNGVFFTKRVLGQRPSCVDDTMVKLPRRQAKANTEPPQRNVWDQAFVQRMFQYFAEEKDANGLENDWNRACPNTEAAQQGLSWLLEIGFQDCRKKDVLSEAVATLISRGVVGWDVLTVALSPFLETIEEMKMDAPMADAFFHSLLSKLLLECGKDFNCSILKSLPMDTDMAWSLILGALKNVKDKAFDAVQHTLSIKGFLRIAAKSRRCTSSELRRHLQEEGLF